MLSAKRFTGANKSLPKLLLRKPPIISLGQIDKLKITLEENGLNSLNVSTNGNNPTEVIVKFKSVNAGLYENILDKVYESVGLYLVKADFSRAETTFYFRRVCNEELSKLTQEI